MNSRRTARMLQGVDAPRAPRPEFERSLRAELFGSDVHGGVAVTDDEGDDPIVEPAAPEVITPITRRSHRTRWLAIAAVVVIVVGVASVVAFQRNDDQVDVSSTPPASVVADARAACARFNASAFGDVGRVGLVGDGNDEVFADPAKGRQLTAQLKAALASFAAELQAAGVTDEQVFARLDVARGDAGAVLKDLDRGSTDQAAEDARLIENELILVERALGDVGVVGCL